MALQCALPAAAAGLAYLNARLSLSYDFTLLSNLVRASLGGQLRERRDDVNLFSLLESNAQAASTGNHPWIIFGGKTWTYAQGYENVLKYGTWLKSKGVQKGDIVAMDFVNSELFIWLWFGLWSIGAKPAFINYNMAGQPLLHMVRTSTASLVLVGEESQDKFAEETMVQNGFTPVALETGGVAVKRAAYEFKDDSSQATSVRKHSVLRGAGEVKDRQLEIVFFSKELENEILALSPVRQPDSERNQQKGHDMAMLIYTSGTTGLPKPAVVSWAKATVGSKFASLWIPFDKSQIMYTAMPLYHSSASILGLIAIMQGGSTLSLSKKFSHKTFWPEVISSQATIIQYVGETCRYLLSAPPGPLDRQHHVRTAFGNGLRPDVWQPFKDRFAIPTICEFYAATESPSGMFNKSANDFGAGAIGRNGSLASLVLGPGLAVVRIDQSASPPEPVRHSRSGLCEIADWDEPGELMYKLDPENISQKFQGYFGNAKATDGKIIRDVKAKGDAYFRTGDVVRWDRDHRWFFVDRLGDTFRWKAENVSTAEVADVVGKHPAVEEANVYGVQVPNHDGRAGCAAVVLKAASTGAGEKGVVALPNAHTLQSLAAHVSKGLPAYAAPLFLRVTGQMQTTGTNKQQKHLLQRDGIEIDEVEKEGDALFWLREGTYEKFTQKDLDRIKGGAVKL
ncbi:acetyl-CoA synthetase-like protein [Corynespora cassiicola Philippines]|uniref:Acetyl-CoA synthetase-like protein n=1 Tax=Corynespora cassiicola Philippines TaxID=1448308 RepID=A0A2T2NY05_CORCC|nr:acetyl-CoA synthetase-like protein [Corynespora cassiicola Philippines]